MPEHSPTPWKLWRVGHEGGFVSDANDICIVGKENGPTDTDYVNWLHIVRCVNLHEQLVAALGSLRQEHQSLCDATEWGVEDHNRKLLDAIDSLLAKAKGE